MIKIKLFTNKNNDLYKISVKGHANYDDYGKDIVCAATTIYLINTINSLIEIVKIDDQIKYNVKEGLVDLEINYDNLDKSKLHDVRLLIKSFELAILSIEKEYPKNIVISKEVQRYD